MKNTVPNNPELEKVDFSNAKPVSEIPALARLQAKHREEQLQNSQIIFDPDVWRLLQSNKTDNKKIADINGFLRVFLAQ